MKTGVYTQNLLREMARSGQRGGPSIKLFLNSPVFTVALGFQTTQRVLATMTKAEKKRLAAVLHATEYLFLENIALKLVLEHRGVPNWQKFLDHLLSDKEMLAGVHLKFRDLYGEIERSIDPAKALEGLLGTLPAAKKTQ